ncbi:MAG: DinB family protein [Segetibacter sp.]|nr:DinB family protein [Segetibacter sp.]
MATLTRKFWFRVIKDFTNHQSVFKLHIKTLQAFFLHPNFIKYPGEAELAFRLEDCVNFLIEYENRHCIQAHEVKTVL